jgi:hypothetical protein
LPTVWAVAGALLLVDETTEDFGWDATEISGFSVEGEPATAGLELSGAALPCAVFGEPMQEASEGPGPKGEEIRSLGQTSDTWEVAQAPATWTGKEAGEAALGGVAVVHGPALARATDIQAGSSFGAEELGVLVPRAAFGAEELGVLVPRAAGAPHPPAKPTRPRQVRIRSEAFADALRPELSSLDIEVEAGQVPLADEALKGRLQNLARQEGKSTSDVVGSLVQHYVRDRDRAEGRLSLVLLRPPW